MFHSIADARKGLRLVGNIDESYVEACSFGQRIVLMCQAVGLAYAAAHKHAVDGMAQALFRYRYQECHRGVRSASGIGGGDYAEGVYKTAELRAPWAKELFDGGGGAELLFFI